MTPSPGLEISSSCHPQKDEKVKGDYGVEGCSRSVIQDCGCDQEGKKLSWETRAEEVGFEVLPKICNRGTVSYMKGEKSSKGHGHRDWRNYKSA